MSILYVSSCKRIQVEPSQREKNGVLVRGILETIDGLGILDFDLTPEQAKELIALIDCELESQGGAA